MVFGTYTYSVLVVSSSQKFNEAVKPLLSESNCFPVSYAFSISEAQRCILEKPYDFIIIRSPLPDDFGIKFAIDISQGKNSVCLMMIKAELHEEVSAKVTSNGVFTISSPTSRNMLKEAMQWMAAVRERLRNAEKKTISLEAKMEEIRLVNRAKWMLIENLNMTESDAHRYIEKQAMDHCITKGEIAENILKTYRK